MLRTRKGPIVLMTDFGLSDGSVGVMEGVVNRINPQAKIIHLTHSVAPFDVRGGAFLLLTSYYHFARGSIFVLVIDPGVGTKRAILLVKSSNYCFVAPDNGILWPIIEAEKVRRIIAIEGEEVRAAAYQLTQDEYFRRPASATFHGRDYFSPTAALFVRGVEISGKEVRRNDLTTLDFGLRIEGESGIGEVVYVDAFGNLVASVTKRDFDDFVGDGEYLISAGGRDISCVSKTYADGREGEVIALFGGDFEHPFQGPFLEIAIYEGNASKELGVGKGDQVVITRR